MGKIFSICNQKGGVGKTTTAVNLAALIAKNHKVLLVDMDSQGNATSGLGIDKPDLEFTVYQLLVENSDPKGIIKETEIENLSIIPSNVGLSGAEVLLMSAVAREFKLKNALDSIKDDYDFIFLDCPPSLGLITVNCLVASDYVLIPLQCEYYALEGLSQLLNTHQLVKQNLNPRLDVGGVILTMADLRTNLTQQVIEEVRGYFKEAVFETIVPRSVKLSEAPSFGKPAVFYDPYNRGSKAYVEIGKEFEWRYSSHADQPNEDKAQENSEGEKSQPEEEMKGEAV